MNNAQQCSYKKVIIGKPTFQNKNMIYMLTLQWLFMISNILLTASLVSSNIRFVIYALMFLINDSLTSTEKICQIQDPLHLSYWLTLSKYLKILLHLNMIYLLVRIVYDFQTITSFFLLLHYGLSYYISLQSLRKIADIGIQKISKSKILNPLILYIFGKTLKGSITDLSLTLLLIFCANCFMATQSRYLVNFSKTLLFGWLVSGEKENSQILWHRKQAIKGVMMCVCGCLLVQNLMLMIEDIRQQISLAIIQTLTIGLMALIMYKTPSKI